MFPWNSHRRRPPPWWPQDEPWPPVRRHWRGRRRLLLVPALLMIITSLGAAFFFVLLFMFLETAQGGATLWPGIVINIPRPIGLVLIAGIAAIVWLIVRVVSRIAAPLGDLVEAAGRVAEGDYSARVAERGTAEVRMLARAFNSMATRLQETDEQRRNLLADVTHELRTPLTVVQGNLEGMVDGIYPTDREHLEPILDETRLLARLIEDLRTLALTESGSLKLQPEATDLATLVGETVASFRPQAETAGVTFQTDIDPHLPTISVDPARIREVLANLLTNALHYTQPGGVIQVQCTAEPEQRRVAIDVSDTGQGIPAQELPHIFDRFYKSRDSRGSGLGLAIARNLVNVHGGEISARSTPGQGTTIRFTLPVSS
ncbi:MAG: HAMP domain-containing sensor histidine kinase [Anaerolineae bacterium]